MTKKGTISSSCVKLLNCCCLNITTEQSSPLFHLQFDVNALFFQKLPLGIVPVLWLRLLLSRSAALSLQSGLLRVVKAEHVVLPHDDAITCHRRRESGVKHRAGDDHSSRRKSEECAPCLRMTASVICFPLTYVSAPISGSRVTTTAEDKSTHSLIRGGDRDCCSCCCTRCSSS